jgi:hypothetical protein
MRVLGSLATILGFTAVLGAAPPVAAGDLSLTAGVEGAQTTWDDDGAVFGSLRVSMRWWKHVSLYAHGKAGAAAVDERGIQQLSLGAELWTAWGPARPYLRFGAGHQHELPGDALDADPKGTLFGYGDGIRHRGGLGAAVGAQLPVRAHARGDYFVGVELFADRLTGAPGPSVYWGAGLALGFRYER